jgi:hypothetical protein
VVYRPGLLFLEVVADLGEPLDGVAIDAEVVEVVIREVVLAVAAAIRIAAVILQLLLLLPWRLFLRLFLLALLTLLIFKAFIRGASIGDVDGTVVEEFAKGDEVGGVEEGAEATTDCVDVDPFIVLVIEPFIVSQLSVSSAELLKLRVFLLEVAALLVCCLTDGWVCKQSQLRFLPERHDINIF